jgi:hypothetical protein
MPLNDKQKTYLRIGIAGLVFFYIAPRIIGMYEQHQAMQRAAFAAAHAKPSPAIPMHKDVAPNTPLPIPFLIATGKYEGVGIEKTRQCKIDLEVRAGENGTFMGYVTMVCFEPPHVIPGKPAYKQNPILEAARQMTPASAIMTGAAKNGDLVFAVDKSIGTLGDGFPVTGTFTVSTFGTGKVLVQWQEGTCGGGQLLLQHV